MLPISAKMSSSFSVLSKSALAAGICLAMTTFAHAGPVTLEWVTTAPAMPDLNAFPVNVISAVTARITILDGAAISAGRILQNSNDLISNPALTPVAGLLIWQALGVAGVASGWDNSIALDERVTCPPLLNPDGTQAFPASTRTPFFTIDLVKNTSIAPNAFTGRISANPTTSCSRPAFAPSTYTVSFATGNSGGFSISNDFSGAGGGLNSPQGYWSVVSTTATVPVPTTVVLIGLGLLGFGASRRRK
jgi:hypothetical protein